MQLGFTFGILHTLLSFGSNYLELKSQKPEIQPFHPYIALPNNYMVQNSSFCEIPVKMPKKEGEVVTLVSPEDYPRLLHMSGSWRMNSKGYVVSSSRAAGKYRLTYMHREIAGHTATHLNGDRLDNRRSNLIPAKPRSPPVILSAPPILDHIYQAAESTRPSTEKQQTVEYSDGKIYSGEVHNNIPHGLGTLIEKNRSTFGWFLFGTFRSGIVIDHPDVPDRLRYLYQQERTRPIASAFVVLKNGTHVNIGEARKEN